MHNSTWNEQHAYFYTCTVEPIDFEAFPTRTVKVAICVSTGDTAVACMILQFTLLNICKNRCRTKTTYMVKLHSISAVMLNTIGASPTLAGLHCKTHVYVCLCVAIY